MDDRTQYRRQMTGNMPTGEYRLSEQQSRIVHKHVVETKPTESDYDPDAWSAIVESLKRWPE